MKSTIVSGVVALFLSGFAGQVFAQLNPAGTPAEQALLPRYCQVKLKDDNTTPEAKSFVSQFGFANWLHLHHYCYALNYLNRANKAGGAKARDSLRRSAAADYRYVLGKSRPDFWMRPQLLVELGRLHIQLNEAAATFLRTSPWWRSCAGRTPTAPRSTSPRRVCATCLTRRS